MVVCDAQKTSQHPTAIHTHQLFSVQFLVLALHNTLAPIEKSIELAVRAVFVDVIHNTHDDIVTTCDGEDGDGS